MIADLSKYDVGRIVGLARRAGIEITPAAAHNVEQSPGRVDVVLRAVWRRAMTVEPVRAIIDGVDRQGGKDYWMGLMHGESGTSAAEIAADADDAAARLRALIEDSPDTIAEVARRAGMQPAQLSQVKTGRRVSPSLATAGRILRALGRTWADLDPAE